jgi:hypothetical protein
MYKKLGICWRAKMMNNVAMDIVVDSFLQQHSRKH